ncbi:three component ABC system middle component [Mycobacteroides abscessus]|uniref:three component ABC system middle component n=1 Tax=Mycobacteroides abscessus TaxID=36809 RepID=UPI00373FD54C
MSTPWGRRNPVVAANFNPALVARLIESSANGYVTASGAAMPLAFCYLMAPLVLHSPTRQSLPRTTRTHLSTWAKKNRLLQVGLSERTQSLQPFVNEAIRIGIRYSLIKISEGGVVLPKNTRYKDAAHTSSVANMVKAAGFVGRWLAQNTEVSTPFLLLGVRLRADS